MSEEYLKILEKALEGIELTEEENRLVEWIAGWDLWYYETMLHRQRASRV